MAGNIHRLVAVPDLSLRNRNSVSTSRTPATTHTPPVSTPVPTDAGETGRTGKKHVTKQEYDVYAATFVPGTLREVSQAEPRDIKQTQHAHRIENAAYILSFAGTDFLPRQDVDSVSALHHPDTTAPIALGPSTYREYFVTLWKVEFAAKNIHTLYDSEIYISDHQRLYMLTVPGIREDNPLVERGDTLHLRQLYIDDRDSYLHLPPVTPIWSGVQYNASVFAVDRAQERVFLEISGLLPRSMRFNVTFPWKQPLLQAQWNALSSIHIQLQSIQDQQHIYGRNYDIDAQASLSLETPPRNDWIRRMTFPEENDGRIQRRLRQLAHSRGLFDAQCNYEQLQAVNSACEADFGVLPFLISGPPGTGKTKTLVETALQLLNTTDVVHILVCAPSDQAADILALRLRSHLSPEKLLRLNGTQRADNEVPGELLGYCYRDHDMFYLPPFRQLMRYNIVVTSTRDAAILANARVTNADLYLVEKNMLSAFHPEEESTRPTRLHWGALLLDEAAQATEIDVMPALTVVMPPRQYPVSLPQPRLIMAGDQEQLGPRTASNDPRYSCSLFARLFERPLYKNHPLSRNNIRPSVGPPVLNSSMLPMLYPPFVNLMRNYRSHPAILTVPSCLFYNDTLIPEAPIETHTPLQTSSLWQGKKHPVLYVPVTAPDEIEYEGGGWYNSVECRTACAIAARLVAESEVRQRDVAIISPFATQVKRLRHLMRSPAYGLWDVNIGPLEAFQGLESRVVILCTTRTRERFLAEDIKRGVGIIGLRRKMNVALTRAKAGLVVLGNPHLLALDEHWKAFLAFCHRNGLVQGKPFREEIVKGFEGCKVGVLEKALDMKEKHKVGRGLGSAATARMFIGEEEDQMWAEALGAEIEQLALDGEEDEEQYEELGDGEVEEDVDTGYVAEDEKGEQADLRSNGL